MSLLSEGFNHNGVSVHRDFWYHEGEIPPKAGYSAIVPHYILQQSTSLASCRVARTGHYPPKYQSCLLNHNVITKKTHQARCPWFHASCMTRSEAGGDTRRFLPGCLLFLLRHSKYVLIPMILVAIPASLSSWLDPCGSRPNQFHASGEGKVPCRRES